MRGVVIGLLVGLLAKIPLGVGATRRGRAARKAIEARVSSQVEARVFAPVSEVVADQAEISRLLDVAIGKGS